MISIGIGQIAGLIVRIAGGCDVHDWLMISDELIDYIIAVAILIEETLPT